MAAVNRPAEELTDLQLRVLMTLDASVPPATLDSAETVRSLAGGRSLTEIDDESLHRIAACLELRRVQAVVSAHEAANETPPEADAW